MVIYTESVSISADVLCNLKMPMQLLYVASVGLKSPLYIRMYVLYTHCFVHISIYVYVRTCWYFPLPSGEIMQYYRSECAVVVMFVSCVTHTCNSLTVQYAQYPQLYIATYIHN